MSDLISDPPRDPFANYEPKGVRFTEGGREWLLVQEPGYHFDGWLCRRHPDGQWVSMRKATDEDKATLAGVTTVAAPSSSAEPAPPTCNTCGDTTVEGYCHNKQCSRHGRKNDYLADEKSSLSPVQEEATPTLDAATAIRVLTAVAEMYDGKAKHNDGQLSKARDGRLLSEVQREIADVAASVASALPALLEASRRDQQTAKALEATNIGGIMDIFTDSADALTQMALHIRDLETRLAGSISERETLTAHRVDMEAQIDAMMRDWNEALKAVARLTTERDKFQAWFQNAEQARAVAEATVERLTRERAQLVEDIRREQDAHFHTGRERDRLASDIRAHKSWGKHL